MRVRSIRFVRFTDATCASSFEIAVDATCARPCRCHRDQIKNWIGTVRCPLVTAFPLTSPQMWRGLTAAGTQSANSIKIPPGPPPDPAESHSNTSMTRRCRWTTRCRFHGASSPGSYGVQTETMFVSFITFVPPFLRRVEPKRREDRHGPLSSL